MKSSQSSQQPDSDIEEKDGPSLDDLVAVHRAKVDQKRSKRFNNNIITNAAFFSMLEDFSRTLKGVQISAPKQSKKKDDYDVNIVISDTHFGASLAPDEVLTPYGFVEEARRLSSVMVRILDSHPDKSKRTLRIHLLGDIIQGQLHDPRDGEPMADQVCDAIFLLSQFIGTLASAFHTVHVYCSTGNHGRNTARHKERAVLQKYDSLETIVYFALQQSCKSPNLHFHIPKLPYYLAESGGVVVLGTHGDTVIPSGNPGRSVSVERMDSYANRLVSHLDSIGGPIPSVFVVGHAHTPTVVYLGDGKTFIVNGSLVPSDPYGQSIGYLTNTCGQVMFETHPDGVRNWTLLRVGPSEDVDTGLDAHIQSYGGLR